MVKPYPYFLFFYIIEHMDWYVQWFGNPYQDPYYDTQRGQEPYYQTQEPQYEPYQQYDSYQPQYIQQGGASLWYVQPQQYLNNYADVYSQSNPALSQQYRNLANQAGMRWDTQRNILNWYDGLANDVANRQQYVTDISGNLANNLLWDINNQRDYIYSLYWPNGSITQEVNDYYSGLSNAIAWDTGRQLAQSDVNAKMAGVSVWANRNTQNQIYNEGYERALKAKEADINAKNNIVSALQNYMTALRTEYWDTTDKYIIQKYQQANDLLNQIQGSMTQDMVNLENSKLQFNMQRALSGWAGGWQEMSEEEKVLYNNFLQSLSMLQDASANGISEDVLNNSDQAVFVKSYLESHPDIRNEINKGFQDSWLTWYTTTWNLATDFVRPLAGSWYIPQTMGTWLTFNTMQQNNGTGWWYYNVPWGTGYSLTWMAQ